MGYGHLLFKRGYLITDSSLDGSTGRYAGLVRGWKKETARSLAIYAHPDLDINLHRSDGLTVVLLGFAVDPSNGLSDTGEILRRLHSLYLKSTEGFFDYVDTINGRFVLLVDSANRSFVLHDAMGTKTVFYDAESENTVISSHASLVADVQGYEMSPAARELISSPEYFGQNSYFPGVATPYSSVKILTANTLLDIGNRTVQRFFPRERLETGRITDELAEEVARLFSEQIDLLSRDHRLAVSLSGGFDSRTTMAAACDHRKDITYFTYGGLQKYEDDARLANEVCSRFGLDHMVLRKEDCGVGLEEFLGVWMVNTAFMRSDDDGAVAKALYESRLRGALHLKSNGSEITRVWYRWGMKHRLPNRIAPDTYALLYNIRPRSPFVVDAFRRYVETVEFRPEAFFGYDVYDLLYWEHRVSAWHTLQILDTDAAYDNFNIFNNRQVLKMLLSVPFGDRLRGRLQYRVLESLLPEALEVPFYKDLKPRYVTAAKTLAKHAKYYVDRALPG